MKLIVGLGNPGRKYEGTRHNVGFGVLEELARDCAVGKVKEKFKAEIVEASIRGEKALLLCPQTYMNHSGTSVGAAMDFYKLDVENLLVVCDDFHLPVGKLRMRARGSAGGQKGLADIIRRLGLEELARLRFGIGPLPPRWEATDFVLSKFSADELPEVKETIARGAGAVVDWAEHGTEYCMNKYNG